jgi:hypothetical protein
MTVNSRAMSCLVCRIGPVLELPDLELEAQVEQFLLEIGHLALHFVGRHLADLAGVHRDSLLSMNLVLIDSLWAASRKASTAISRVTPWIS